MERFDEFYLNNYINENRYGYEDDEIFEGEEFEETSEEILESIVEELEYLIDDEDVDESLKNRLMGIARRTKKALTRTSAQQQQHNKAKDRLEGMKMRKQKPELSDAKRREIARKKRMTRTAQSGGWGS